MQTPGSEADAPLYQERLRQLAKVGFFLCGGFLLFRAVLMTAVGFYQYLLHPSMYWHIAATTVLAAMWSVLRVPDRPPRLVRAVENVGLLLLAGCFAAMESGAPAGTRPEHIAILSLTPFYVLRAAFIPSTARRTTLVTSLAAIPLAAMCLVIYREGCPFGCRGWVPMGTAVAWWVTMTAVCAAISSVIYGLRRDVRHALRLGQYTLQRKLGEGGMGVVYRAHHGMLRRPTAVKLLPPERAGADAVARFEREVQRTAQLTHPNTVTVFDYGRTPDGVFYYAMELLDGATLRQIVAATGPLPPARVVHVARQIAGSLREAHESGLVHRDIKPENIMLCQQGGTPDVAKVLDFGLVKSVRGDEPGVTHAGLVGTPRYLAPEVMTTPEAVDGRADIYALGAVMYYLLVGVDVFEGRTMMEVCAHHLNTPPVPPSTRLGRPLPEGLERLVLACLAKDAAQRPDAAGLLARLDTLAAEVGRWTEADARAWWTGPGAALVAASGDGEGTDIGQALTVALDSTRGRIELSAG